MSHFSRIQTQIVDKAYLTQALSDLGFQYEEGRLQVQGFLGQKAEVEILLHLNSSYGIGLRQTGGSYEVVADWAGVRGLNQRDFVQRLTQRYAYHAARAQLEAKGFALVEETNQINGEIHMVLRRISG
jgi:hypothetical protein